jgi:hypothetical protein
MKKEKILLKLDSNYADEFDVSGLLIVDREQWEKDKLLIGDYKKSLEMYFGSNESLDYENGKEFLEEIEEMVITEEQEKFLKKIFEEKYYAFGNIISDVIESVKSPTREEDEWEEDDEEWEDDEDEGDEE